MIFVFYLILSILLSFFFLLLTYTPVQGFVQVSSGVHFYTYIKFLP